MGNVQGRAPDGGRPLTGRKVLLIVVGFFAVIIGVNLTMAFQAVSTFPGLEVKNSYVASQTFDAERASQEALGWQVTHEYGADGVLSLVMRDAQGMPAPIKALSVTIGRTTHTRDDRPLDLAYTGGIYTTKLDLEPGNWLLHLNAESADGVAFRQRYDMFVNG
ncbi:nitrogen fixation protein FixH [Frigidibacter albus]|uniref:Nitrogen fixation protein FixH n=1 Tax=Frigidibacter albus TaxID=1465486 RepID=A0A6L8VLB1_9RHOB|nr:FixH family protein [Frigidibacter albus]MZQ90496.1 nitrogen fixation protein FixH [Frigidibacter albus]NBE32384.1 nitrogen fixation protein FixH [Frigidibacter albus]GGH59489.1 RdxH [Frigidibacter albus]